jgi:hypothetical protein
MHGETSEAIEVLGMAQHSESDKFHVVLFLADVLEPLPHGVVVDRLVLDAL